MKTLWSLQYDKLLKAYCFSYVGYCLSFYAKINVLFFLFAPWEISSKENISTSATQHVLLLSLCGKPGVLIIIKSMLPIYKSSFKGSTCQSSSHGGRGQKTVDFRLKAVDSCILGCNDGFLGFWGLLQQFRRVTVLYFVPGNTKRGFTPHIEIPQRQKSWGEIIFLNLDQMYSSLQVVYTENRSIIHP